MPVEETDADLSVSKAADQETALDGSNITYTIEVINGGPAPAINVQLNDTLPEGMTFVSLSAPDGWSCSTPNAGDSGTITCTIPSLDPNINQVFTLVGQIPPETPENTFFTNVATVSSETFDPNDENNSGVAVTVVSPKRADAGITKSSASGTARPDTDVTYTIEARNGGPDAAENFSWQDTLPGDMTFVSLTQNSGPALSCSMPAVGAGGTITCTSASLPANSVTTFTLVGHIPSGAQADTIYTNTATVSTTVQDPNEVNNISVFPITVVTCDTTFVVTTGADSGAGSLRQAIQDICSGGAITFDPALSGPITLTSAELLINKSLTIEGPGANLLTVRRDAGASNFRIFNIASGNTVTISGLAIENGNAEGGNGGGIANFGTLTLRDIALSGNSAGGSGGALHNSGTLRVLNSALSGNSASLNGGGINNTGTLTLTNMTLSGNSAVGSGGGIYNDVGGATLINVTVTNNRADSDDTGGGTGGGIHVNSGSVLLRNTIVALNFRGTGSTPDDLSGVSVNSSSSFNLIGTGGSGGLTNGVNNNQVGVADPRLAPLANNGGPTQTHALLAGSPALDAGDSALLPPDSFDLDGDTDTVEPLPFDQRGPGFLRVTDSADVDTSQAIDVGAYEAQVSVEDITDKVTDEDTPLSFSFNVGDVSLITSVTATSSNQTLVPDANLSITGTGSTRTLEITPAANLSGTTTITVTVNGANSQTMKDTFVLTVNAVNDPPVNLVPGPQSVTESGSLIFSSASSNQLSISDVDAGANIVSVTLTAINGTLTLNGTNGLTFTPVSANNDGTADSQLSFTGTISDINTALNGLQFTPAQGYDGPASIQIQTSDNGFTGSGGIKVDDDTISIAVLDGGTLAFSAASYTVDEGAGTATITVTRTGGSSGEARVNYETIDGTAIAGAGQDYLSSTGQLIFANGETSKSFTVVINDDTLDETAETINLKLSNVTGSGELGSQATAVLTITDNDSEPSLSINDVSSNEGQTGTTGFTFTVTLSAASGLPITVNYATDNGTATAPSDYQAVSSTQLAFAPGETTRTVTVLVSGDTVNEPNETFFVNLSGAVNATISDNQGSGTILNDDAPGVQLSSSSYSFSEGSGHGDIIVTRGGDISQPMTVDYITSDQSGLTPCQTNNNGFASDRCDYATAAGTLTFAAGEAQKTIQLVLIDDAYVEPPEQLTITLSNPVGATLGSTSVATITITDNDTQVATTNPIDDLDFFIRQQYIDFLGREPDAAGFAFWKNRMTNSCPPQETCDRIDTSLRFFVSDEFRERGYFVYLFYHAALGRRPTYSEWIMDVSKLNGLKTVAEQEAAKQAFIDEFISRQEFQNLYNGFQTGEAFVDALIQKSGVMPESRQALINNYATVGRARTLRAFIETVEVQAAFVDRAFVTMLYFGYLRRDAEPGGFAFWMQKLNESNRDYRLLVGGFLNSDEYRFRFAQVPPAP